jgi:general secretion pathway protein I
MKRSVSHATRGFTLLEVLIAAVVMGTTFAAVMGLLSQSLRNIERMKPQEQMLLHARDKMSEMLLEESLLPNTTAGQWEDGYRWQVQVGFEPMLPEAPPAPEPISPGSLALFRIRVQISWGQGAASKTYALETLQWTKVDRYAAN